jgi:3-oxoacyl-[acyl-carrier-protein] synthase II
MRVYINSAASISPQKTFDNPLFLNELVSYNDGLLTCIEPDYSGIIDPRLIRRMSRIIKISVASALSCLKAAGVTNPDAIITGTAYGCLEDTGIFLTNMIEQAEEPITPTAFVQSTHNTIGAQIALLIKCTGYNNTFVSGGASFEYALLDAMMLLMENAKANILLGGIDEITSASHAVLTRMGLYKRPPVSNLDLFSVKSKGTIGGEGAAFFLLSGTSSKNSLACIEAATTFYKPESTTETGQLIKSFLKVNDIDCSTIDLVVSGNNGDEKNDEIYNQLALSVFKGIPSVNYKNLCGEYPTSGAFALWLAVGIIKTNSIPALLNLKGAVKNKLNKVLIYNHYQNTYHSLILISAC